MLWCVCVSPQFPRLCTSLFSPGPEAKMLKCNEESYSHGVSSPNRTRRERGNLMRKPDRFPAQSHSGPWSFWCLGLSPHFRVPGSPATPERQQYWCPGPSCSPVDLGFTLLQPRFNEEQCICCMFPSWMRMVRLRVPSASHRCFWRR